MTRRDLLLISAGILLGASALALINVRSRFGKAQSTISMPTTLSAVGDADLQEMQGEWDLISMRSGGQEVQTGIKSCVYRFDAATMTVCPEGRRNSFYTLRLDSDSSPKRMDIIATWESGQVSVNEVVYEIHGNILRWCESPGKRPEAFLDGNSGAGTLITLRRAVRATDK